MEVEELTVYVNDEGIIFTDIVSGWTKCEKAKEDAEEAKAFPVNIYSFVITRKEKLKLCSAVFLSLNENLFCWSFPLPLFLPLVCIRHCLKVIIQLKEPRVADDNGWDRICWWDRRIMNK